jgi:hypothetical protein
MKDTTIDTPKLSILQPYKKWDDQLFKTLFTESFRKTLDSAKDKIQYYIEFIIKPDYTIKKQYKSLYCNPTHLYEHLPTFKEAFALRKGDVLKGSTLNSKDPYKYLFQHNNVLGVILINVIDKTVNILSQVTNFESMYGYDRSHVSTIVLKALQDDYLLNSDGTPVFILDIDLGNCGVLVRSPDLLFFDMVDKFKDTNFFIVVSKPIYLVNRKVIHNGIVIKNMKFPFDKPCLEFINAGLVEGTTSNINVIDDITIIRHIILKNFSDKMILKIAEFIKSAFVESTGDLSITLY